MCQDSKVLRNEYILKLPNDPGYKETKLVMEQGRKHLWIDCPSDSEEAIAEYWLVNSVGESISTESLSKVLLIKEDYR